MCPSPKLQYIRSQDDSNVYLQTLHMNVVRTDDSVLHGMLRSTHEADMQAEHNLHLATSETGKHGGMSMIRIA